MDGGIRRGTDVAVALALGADAVLAGRAPLWGLAVDGQAGAERALGFLAEELRLALALLGCPSPRRASHASHVAGALASLPAPMENRLSASDMSSLFAERGQIHVHVGGTIVVEGAPPSYESCSPTSRTGSTWCPASASGSSRSRSGSRTRSGPTTPASTSAATCATSRSRAPAGSTSCAT